MSTAENPPGTAPQSPALYGLASLVIPGLGQLLLKQRAVGVRILLWALALWAGALAQYSVAANALWMGPHTQTTEMPAYWFSLLCLLGAVVLTAAAAANAFRVAQRLRGETREVPGAASRAQPSLRYAPDALDRRPVEPSKLGLDLGLILIGALFLGAFARTGADLGSMEAIPGNFRQYTGYMLDGLFQPLTDEVREQWANAFEYMFQSVAIAWIGTVVGAMFSLPMGFLAARNMSPTAVYGVARLILAFFRAVPEIVFAVLLMVPIFGIGHIGGAMAGAMALGVSSIGTLSKLISEAIEGVDDGPLESARASGASQVQVIRWAVLPQVMPEVIAIWLYRFEVNIRASAILGVLGVGGIGTLLKRLFDNGRWQEMGIALVVIIAVTMVIDQISAWIRHRVIHGAKVRASSDKGDDGTRGSGEDPLTGSDGPSPNQARAEVTAAR
ncbi:phosphonate ABC transporter, permease protein PhnE [Nesterenkonia flava]|uniref:Phosphonate ABC transporter, permease protein PhnE n=1 Tax=Nesterenkonia flava TaxID=469799 RepID=A0ABU1FTE6_9MICC|nr:phosphonate ABC transporter, permease protein PhnE [Nesterenkonia flava]MDR5711936.1 phosphonate ABC transporter, permease protein PhnE [Nesterenkonia flava]